ncbi:unnamed protein product [Didymodactylos carnosus]|uniref:Uncharacterized protein n=1 Tax=Didymodactylos carnosus TaxID=1234261 RepID=A0A8S2EQ31_9BILA|nr:unnamed protein product [Didymodactylos carnosus]CAF4015015.1 unnamed protein product [Didymodactylos carnosus]
MGSTPATTLNLKPIAVAIVEQIPVVGGFYSFILDQLWPDGRTNYWEEVKHEVMRAIGEAIDHERLRGVELQLQGIKGNIAEVASISNPSQRCEKVTTINSLIVHIRPHFMCDDNKLATFPYFLSLATLHIAILKSQFILRDTIDNRQLLIKYVREYVEYAHRIFPELVQHRLGKITGLEGPRRFDCARYFLEAHDRHTNNRVAAVHWHIEFPYHNGIPFEQIANQQLQAYREQVRLEATRFYTEMLSPIDYWRDLYIPPAMRLNNSHVALFSECHRRFVRIDSKGNANSGGPVTNRDSLPRDWTAERFVLHDLGFDDQRRPVIALHCLVHNRFLRANSNNVVDSSSPSSHVPDCWQFERLVVVHAGDAQIALFSHSHKQFIRMKPDGKMDLSGRCEVNGLADDWQWEKFSVVSW